MTGHSDNALLTIGQVVAELQSDHAEVTHSSLRFLEREGLVRPARTGGGHRLYSRRDVERIRLIKSWQRRRYSLDEIRTRLEAADGAISAAELSSTFLEASLRGELEAAARSVARVDDAGMPLERIFEEVMRPALYEIGVRWASGLLPVSAEKEISEFSRDLIAELSRRHESPSDRGPVAVAACVSGERHDLGLRMVIGLLRQRGWRVHFLGTDVGVEFLLESVQRRQPEVVLLSITSEELISAALIAVRAVRGIEDYGRGPVIAVGGHGVEGHRTKFIESGANIVFEGGLAALIDAVDTRRSEVSRPAGV